MPLTKVALDISVDRWSAEVRVQQSFLNKGDAPLEILYHFPKEPGCVLHRLSVQIGEDIFEGKCLEKEEAQNRFDDAIASGRTAALLEQTIESLLTMTVGCLPAHTRAECRLSYVVPLSIHDGWSALRIPTTLAPSIFSSNLVSAASGADASTNQPCSVPYSLSIKANAPPSVPTLSCPSHPKASICTDGDGNTVISYEASDMGLEGDFVIHASHPRPLDEQLDRPSHRSEMVVERCEKEKSHLYATGATFMFPAQPSSALAGTKSNVSILLDCSQSMQGRASELSRQFVRALLGHVCEYPANRLNVITFGSSATNVFETSVTAKCQTKKVFA